MTTVKEFFEMTKLIYNKNIDIDVYPDQKNLKYFENMVYNYKNEQRIISEVFLKYANHEIAFIKSYYEDDSNTLTFYLMLSD